MRAPVLLVVQAAEANGIHHRDRPRAHREDVAKNAANAGCRTLEGLDKAGMVVGFNFKGNGESIADIDDAGILARPLQHALAFSRQLLQVNPRTLVGAMFAPHHTEDAQFGKARLTPKQAQDLCRIQTA